MHFLKKERRQSGVTFVEVLVAVGIITVILVVVGYSVTAYIEARAKLVTNLKSLYLAEEGYEMLRALRDEDWTVIEGLTLGSTYSFAVSTTTLGIVGGVEVIDGGYYRSFVVGRVTRDADDDIDLSGGGTIDSNIRRATISVANSNGTTSLEAIITNLHAI